MQGIRYVNWETELVNFGVQWHVSATNGKDLFR